MQSGWKQIATVMALAAVAFGLVVTGGRLAAHDAALKVMGRLSAAGMRVSVFTDREIWDRMHGRSNSGESRQDLLGGEQNGILGAFGAERE